MVSDYYQLFEMANNDRIPCSDIEYSNPLEIAVKAGAKLSTPDKAGIFRQRKAAVAMLCLLGH